MTIAYLCVVISGLSWMTLDVIRKKLTLKFESPSILFLLSAGMLPSLVVYTFLSQDFKFNFGYLPYGILICILNFFANLMFLKSFQIEQISKVIPMLSFIPLFSAVGSYFILGESLSTLQIVGIFLVVAGALILHDFKLQLSKGSLLMLMVASIWSINSSLDKKSLEFISIGLHGVFQTFFISVLSLGLILKSKKDIHEIPKQWKLLMLMSVLGALGFSMYLVGVRVLPVALCETIKRTIGMLGAVVLGFVIFKEHINWQKIVSLIVLSSGVYFLLA